MKHYFQKMSSVTVRFLDAAKFEPLALWWYNEKVQVKVEDQDLTQLVSWTIH